MGFLMVFITYLHVLNGLKPIYSNIFQFGILQFQSYRIFIRFTMGVVKLGDSGCLIVSPQILNG